MYIDPKDLSLQDAAGMQLANIIRQIPEGGGSSGASIIYSELQMTEGAGQVTLTSTKTAAELIDKDVIIFYANWPKRNAYFLCVNKDVANDYTGFNFTIIANSLDQLITLSCYALTDFPTGIMQDG